VKRALTQFYACRCRAADDDGCRLFVGRTNGYGYGYLRPGRGQRQVLAHRHAWALEHGKAPAAMVNVCGQTMCMTLSHWKPLDSMGAVNTWKAQTGRSSRGVRHSVAILARRRAVAPKGSIELARTIRALDASGTLQRQQIAAQFGVSKHYVTLVCQGRIWRETTPFSI
jgi:hypothetical protein